MAPHTSSADRSTCRREFLKRSGSALTGAAMVSSVAARSYAGEDNTIKIALVGCGGRGTGAARNALLTKGPTKLWAMADVFEHRLAACSKNLSKEFGAQAEVPPERQFLGLSGYRQAIDALDAGDVVLLTTPPAFRPIHLEHAVAKGCNVFMEKSFAVDAPGVRRVLRAGALAEKKNLKIAGGLMSRHYPPLEEAVRHLHEGMIGKIITCWAYRAHGPVGFRPRPQGMTELAHQIQNYSNFTWLNGSFLLDWLIHNIDVCCADLGLRCPGRGRSRRPLSDRHAWFCQGSLMQNCRTGPAATPSTAPYRRRIDRTPSELLGDARGLGGVFVGIKR